MSQENVESVKRMIGAFNLGQGAEPLLQEVDPEVEWHPALQAFFGGETAVYRRHEGVREMLRDFYDTFDELHIDGERIEDLGDRVVAIGSIRGRGKESGAQFESEWGAVADFKEGKAIRVSTHLDRKEALDAGGLRA